MSSNTYIIKKLLTREIQEFIRSHEYDDEYKLLLKSKHIGDVHTSNVVDQIMGRRKAKEKLPTFYKADQIIYPPSINLEQASSEQVAQFKTTLLKTLDLKSYKHGVDLTGGFGVDTFFLSKIFDRVSCVEPNGNLLEIVKNNHFQLHQTNISYHTTTAEEFLVKNHEHVDLIYIDPSRRKSNSRKVFRFTDCAPNVIMLINTIFQRSDLLLIKASPLLDIQQGIKELKYVKYVYVISVNNECKELIFICEKNFEDEAIIETINIEKKITESFSFKISDERILPSNLSEPFRYLYEPNAAILKAGAFKSIAMSFGLLKVHPNTHLYTSNEIINSFPGKIFRIETYIKPDKKIIKQHLPDMKANITLRNHPLTIKDVKKKTNLTEGGQKYLIGFSGKQKKYFVIAERLR